MIYTFCFYIILFLITKNSITQKNAIKFGCTIIAVYTSLRYNYPSDYPAYEYCFNMFNMPNYVYDVDVEHMEYGWFLLNRLFAPFGYYVFVAFCSCLFAHAICKLSSLFIEKRYVSLCLLGIVAMGGFTTLLSAQRQLLVTSIFLIAYRYLLYNKIHSVKDLLKLNTFCFFLIIIGCYYFHKAAIFLFLIPFVYLLPSRKNWVMLVMVVTALFFLFLGDQYLPMLFTSFTEKTGDYEYLRFTGEYTGNISLFQAAMWFFQFINVAFVYKRFKYNDDERTVLLISMLAILVTMTGYSVGQVGRIAHFIYVFTFFTIAITLKKYKGTSYFKWYYLINCVWVLWNLAKVFSIPRGTLHEYKFLLTSFF